jgi:hypothetical protein
MRPDLASGCQVSLGGAVDGIGEGSSLSFARPGGRKGLRGEEGQELSQDVGARKH